MILSKGLDRHTVAVVMCCNDCCDLMKLSLPKLLWADEILISDVGRTSEVKNYVTDLSSKIKHIKTDEDDFALRFQALRSATECDFILWVDTDEFYNDDLADEILRALRKPCHFAGFLIPQNNYDYGVSMGRGLPWLRLFLKDKVQFPFKGSPHLLPTVSGSTDSLVNAYDHIRASKLGVASVKHFRYSAMWASRMTDDELMLQDIGSIHGFRLFCHALGSLARINVRYLRALLRNKNHGFASLCHAYSEIIRVIAEDVSLTEELGMRRGLIERGNRGYY